MALHRFEIRSDGVCGQQADQGLNKWRHERRNEYDKLVDSSNRIRQTTENSTVRGYGVGKANDVDRVSRSYAQ